MVLTLVCNTVSAQISRETTDSCVRLAAAYQRKEASFRLVVQQCTLNKEHFMSKEDSLRLDAIIVIAMDSAVYYHTKAHKLIASLVTKQEK